MAKSVNKMSGKASTASKARNLNRKPARTSKANVSALKKTTKATSKVQQANKKSGPRKMVAKTVGQRKRGPKPAGPKKMMTKTAPLSKLMGATH